MTGERKRYPLFGEYPRGYVDPFAPEVSGREDRERYAASFPDWCKPMPGREQPWFRVNGVLYWASVGKGCGTCRAWDDVDKSIVVTSAPNWRLLKMRLASLHGLSVGAVEVRPNLPIWVEL